MEKTLRIVITGGPGTGKSTVLKGLQQRGYPCHWEISRSVIKEELEKGTALLPWEDLPGFSEKVFTGQIAQYHQAEEGKVNFFDRGIIDVIAYLKKDLLPTEALEKLVEHYPYHNKIFVTPPWPGIYQQDTERREDLKTMEAIHHSLVDTYRSFAYEVIEVPKVASGKRVEFVLRHLNL